MSTESSSVFESNQASASLQTPQKNAVLEGDFVIVVNADSQDPQCPTEGTPQHF